ncbi:MAG: hypothetical protein ABIZ18_07050, partial [Caldimonas sp.]
FKLPPRPEPYVPIPVEHGKGWYVALDTVSEPARTGIQRWLVQRGLKASSVDLINGGCVTEAQFVEFLTRAV